MDWVAWESLRIVEPRLKRLGPEQQSRVAITCRTRDGVRWDSLTRTGWTMYGCYDMQDQRWRVYWV